MSDMGDKLKRSGTGKRGRIGAKPVYRNISFEEWLEGENALKFATREQVVAYSQFQLMEQIFPMFRAILAEERRRLQLERWYRRLWLWIVRIFRPQMTREQALEVLRRDPRFATVGDDEPGHPDGESPTLDPRAATGTIGGTGLPHDNGEQRRSCVTCGSVQLEPISARGGLKCHNGHVIEDEPPEQPGPKLVDGKEGV